MAQVKNFFKYNSFWSLFWDTNKYYEFYDSTAAKLSFILTVLSVGCLWYLLNSTDAEVVNGMLKNMLLTLAAGLTGLLGFLISGLALMATVITQKAIDKLDRIDKIEHLVDVLYSFYFDGGIIGATITSFVFSYFLIHIQAETIPWLYILCCAVISYLFWFSITYSIGLLGSCINTFFANLVYTNDKEYDKN